MSSRGLKTLQMVWALIALSLIYLLIDSSMALSRNNSNCSSKRSSRSLSASIPEYNSVLTRTALECFVFSESEEIKKIAGILLYVSNQPEDHIMYHCRVFTCRSWESESPLSRSLLRSPPSLPVSPSKAPSFLPSFLPSKVPSFLQVQVPSFKFLPSFKLHHTKFLMEFSHCQSVRVSAWG